MLDKLSMAELEDKANSIINTLKTAFNKDKDVIGIEKKVQLNKQI